MSVLHLGVFINVPAENLIFSYTYLFLFLFIFGRINEWFQKIPISNSVDDN